MPHGDVERRGACSASMRLCSPCEQTTTSSSFSNVTSCTASSRRHRDGPLAQGLIRAQRRRFDGDSLAGLDHALELVGRADGDLTAVIYDLDAVADLLDLLHVMASCTRRSRHAR